MSKLIFLDVPDCGLELFQRSTLKDSTRLDLAFYLAVLEDPDGAYLGKSQFRIFQLETGLWIGERLIPALTFESRISRFFSILNSSEKGFEKLVQPS